MTKNASSRRFIASGLDSTRNRRRRRASSRRIAFRLGFRSRLSPAPPSSASEAGASGASGGSGGKEGRCESSMICRTRSTRRSVDSRADSAVVSTLSSAFDRSPPRTRSNGSNTLRPSCTTTPAFADARVALAARSHHVGGRPRLLPRRRRARRPARSAARAPNQQREDRYGEGGERRLGHARTAPSGAASPPRREEVAPRRGRGRADAHGVSSRRLTRRRVCRCKTTLSLFRW